jgi:hypothetical protein
MSAWILWKRKECVCDLDVFACARVSIYMRIMCVYVSYGKVRTCRKGGMHVFLLVRVFVHT